MNKNNLDNHIEKSKQNLEKQLEEKQYIHALSTYKDVIYASLANGQKGESLKYYRQLETLLSKINSDDIEKLLPDTVSASQYLQSEVIHLIRIRQSIEELSGKDIVFIQTQRIDND